MSTGLYSHTTRGTGTTLTAAIYNSDHQNHITNQNPSMTGAYSDNVSQMQAASDPGALGTEVLAASLAIELEHIRFCIRRIVDKAQWYLPPDANLGDLGASLAGIFPKLTITADLTPTLIGANQNDYAPTGHADAFCFRLTSDVAGRTITGLAGGIAGRVVMLANVGSQFITLTNEDAASAAANRFALSSEAPLVIDPGQAAIFRYDGTSSRWRAMHNGGLDNTSVQTSRIGNYQDFVQVAAPANPSAGILRTYVKDVGGVPRLAYRNSGGTETVLAGGGAVDVQTFNASGTWNKPAVGSMARIQVWGPGGGGGTGANPDCGGGGGGGAYNERTMPLSSLGSSETVTIGTGGAGSAGTGDGSAGSGPSSFGSHVSAYAGGGGAGSNNSDEGGGGGGGQLAAGASTSSSSGGAGGSPPATAGGGGAGGAAGADGVSSFWGGAGGGGGGAGGFAGGFSQFGGGGGGGSGGASGTGGLSVHGGAGGAGSTSSGSPASNGAAPGGGGGGGLSAQAGNGAAGRVVVTVW